MKIVPKFTDELLKRVHNLHRNNEFDLENQNTLESLRFLRPKIWDFVPKKFKNSQTLIEFKRKTKL